jgi:hypothetical protein
MKDFFLRHKKMIHLPIKSKTACILDDVLYCIQMQCVEIGALNIQRNKFIGFRSKLTKISCSGVFF